MKNGDMPAMPNALAAPTNDGFLSTSGLTKRELFAAMCLQGILANPGGPVQASSHSGWRSTTNCSREQVVMEASLYADALLAELEEQP